MLGPTQATRATQPTGADVRDPVFELDWSGGAAEHHHRKACPGIEELPWGTIDVGLYPPALVDAARRAWTEVTIAEYRAYVAFARVLEAMALARVPLDLLGMGAAFVADEAAHVELAGRMCMELGGAAPLTVNMDTFARFPIAEGLSHLQRASDWVVRVSCVSEAFSAATAVGSLRAASHPLSRAVHERILADESRHTRLGPLFLDWLSDRIDNAERARLADVALDTLGHLKPFWQRRISKTNAGVTEEGWKVDDIHALGWLESEKMVPLARQVVTKDIVPALAGYGIAPDALALDALLAQ